MSFCTRPIVPAKSAVAAPTTATTSQRLGRVAEQHGVAPDHVHAGRHHRRGVDEGRDRRRAFHGVRQPDVERNLRRLAGGADEEQQRRERQRCRTSPRAQRRRGARDAPGSRACRTSRTAAACRATNAKSPMRLTMKAFLPASDADFFVYQKPMSRYEQRPDALPADEHHQEVRAEHEHQHEGGEQVQVREVARVLADRVSSCM